MRMVRRYWDGLPVSGKLYTVVGIMAVLIAGELLTLQFAMRTLSAVRAFVGGESLWSKAQKNATMSLVDYARTRQESAYVDFLRYLQVPEGDHRARVELFRMDPEMSVVRSGFIQGKIHPDDVEPMVMLLRRFHTNRYIVRAVRAWSEGDDLLVQVRNEAEELHSALSSRHPDERRAQGALSRILELDGRITLLEEEFSGALGEGSRWLEHVVLSILLVAVLMVESVGLTLTFLTSRGLSRSLQELDEFAHRIGQGEFEAKVPIRSKDELGRLAHSVNEMGGLLQKSYQVLEDRVRERTAALSQLAERNEELYERARQAVRDREEFLSIASHELRTPLTGLQLSLQLLTLHLKSGKAKPEQVTHVSNRAFSQARKLGRLLDELLDLSRIQTGKFALHGEECDLVNLAREAIEDSGAQGSAPISLVGPESLRGFWDPLRIQQVFGNLLSNAIKYGDGQPVDVILRREGAFAVVEVVDRGRGVAPEDRQRIFQRFERAADDRSVKGLGLGLYISRQIIEAHRGTIGLASQLGRGSTFQVTLPLEAGYSS